MPVYHSAGITARLALCDLQDSLSGYMDLRMGKELAKDTARIQQILNSATAMRECSAQEMSKSGQWNNAWLHNGLQFVGPERDLPFFEVRADDGVRNMSNCITLETTQTSSIESPQPLSDQVKSPPSDLDTSLSSTFFNHSLQSRLSPLSSLSSEYNAQSSDAQNSVHSSPPREPTEMNTLNQRAQGQALVLQLAMTSKAFLSPVSNAPSRGKDLKVEIFINGILTNVHFVNVKRHASNKIPMHFNFAGLRVHRQCEKAFIYHSDARQVGTGPTAAARWKEVAATLDEESSLRKVNKFGVMPPSAQLLHSLGAKSLPLDLAGQDSFGVVDLIITAGHGLKYGPDSIYLTSPRRMYDPKYTRISPRVQVPAADSSVEETVVPIDEKSTNTVHSEPNLGHEKQALSGSLYNNVASMLSPEIQQNSYLLRRIASTPPRTPIRKRKPSGAISGPEPKFRRLDRHLDQSDRASSMSHGERISGRRGGCARAKASQTTSVQATPVQGTPVESSTSFRNPIQRKQYRRAGPRRSRTASTPKSNESQPARRFDGADFVEAMSEFEPPESFRGSCVSLVADNTMLRQIGKTRQGHFSEQELVVGMRFIVT